ncbi:hypothetical protein FA95DRAFT_1339860 [Auriscalpium vulgare]|uniref:Uncharacterized protein n=1 Tax=Auriscalpium vulgare TaxID=40419 RepID=A0ACB8R1H6_9AGAM|nr:hypothetical protein FA95DRAFT_1339860 [Auriscalpium vulgare]
MWLIFLSSSSAQSPRTIASHYLETSDEVWGTDIVADNAVQLIVISEIVASTRWSLALRVAHAASHPLYLPQPTCLSAAHAIVVPARSLRPSEYQRLTLRRDERSKTRLSVTASTAHLPGYGTIPFTHARATPSRARSGEAAGGG